MWKISATPRSLTTASHTVPTARSARSSQEREHALREQRRSGRVIAWRTTVGEQVLIARVEEQLRVAGGLDELASVRQVLLGEEGVRVHPVDLHGYPVGPAVTKLRGRQAGIAEDRKSV